MSNFELHQTPGGQHPRSSNGKFKVATAMLRVAVGMAKPSYASLEHGDFGNKQDNDSDDVSSSTSSLVSRLGKALKPYSLGEDDESTNEGEVRRTAAAAAAAAIGRDLSEKDEATLKECEMAFATLSSTSPFSYLPKEAQQALVADLQLCSYQEGDVIIEQGRNDKDVYLTREGRVVIFKLLGRDCRITTSPPSFKYLGYLDAGEVFGEFGPLFETTRASTVVAGGNVTAYRMSGERFLRLIPQHAAFKLKMARGLREKGLFRDVTSFVAVVQRSVVALENYMDFDAMLTAYRGMVPAIHAKVHSSALDIEGWTYAIRRLPDTITSTSVFLLSNSLPLPFMHPSFDLEEISVPSAARRRLAFAIAPSKLLVIMRERFSDVLDFISLLCAHIHESRKLRLKLSKPVALDVIHACLWSPKRRLLDNACTSIRDSRYYRHTMYSPAPFKEQADALTKLPLSDEEIRGLQSLWPNDVLYRVWDIIAMHENIQLRGDFSAAFGESSDRWAESIRIAAIGLIQQRSGSNGAVCVGAMTTHIISSNTTSVRNLLSPYIRKHSVEIHKWGMENRPDIEEELKDFSDSDKLCALCTAYMQAHPEARDEQDKFDASCIKIMYETELTGIQVELYDLDALCDVYAEHDIIEAADSYLAPFINNTKKNPESSKRHRLLVNIDYAFGRQVRYATIMIVLSTMFSMCTTILKYSKRIFYALPGSCIYVSVYIAMALSFLYRRSNSFQLFACCLASLLLRLGSWVRPVDCKAKEETW
jgi:CRP-like cAMP-binding protein